MSVELIPGKKGWHLKVNGLYINHGWRHDIKAVRNEIGLPVSASEWVSMKAIRNFWNKYMVHIIHATNNPHVHMGPHGNLQPAEFENSNK